MSFEHANGRVYLTDDITSRGGNSGGPVCVQYDDGRYYPAAIYLGGTTRTRVRVIDSDVIELFDSAEESSNTGQNSGNGGVPYGNNRESGTPPGTLTVNLNPPEARALGAGWRIGSGGFFASGQPRGFLSKGRYRVSFKSIPGYRTPVVRDADVVGGSTTTLNVTYPPALPPVITEPAVRRLIVNEQTSFRIAADNEPTLFSVSGLSGTGLSLTNPGTGQVSGTPSKTGTFTISVSASNDAGTSPPLSITIIVAEPGELIVQADPTRGKVTVQPKRSGNRYPQGEPVTLTAKPNLPHFVFAGWEFAGLEETAETSGGKAKFKMEAYVIATARFVPNPFLTRTGNYHALLGGTGGTPAGILSLKLTKTGSFSGKLLLGTKSHKIKGSFDGNGGFQGVIKRGKLEITLTLDLGQDESSIQGVLIDGEQAFNLLGARALPKARRPAPEAGSYTLILPPDPAQSDPATYPAGHGYALVKVTSAGAVRAKGELGDGTKLSIGGSITADHRLAVFLQPYKKKGLLGGTLEFDPGGQSVTGDLQWQKPASSKGRYTAGFEGKIVPEGGRYTAPRRGEAALEISGWNLALGSGDSGPRAEATVTLDERNRFTVDALPEDAVTLRLKAKTGLLSGSFRNDDGKKISFKGVLLLGARSGRGVLKLPDATEAMTLNPPAIP